jgi:peptidyl-prolyl cis-trans isomerase A (cyclophilin A)
MLRSLIYSALTLLAVSAAAQTASPHKAAASRPAKPSQPALPEVALPADPGRYAIFYTSMGNTVCRLFEQDAPKTVANFVGLATGTKPWKDPATGRMKHTPLYSGTIFHRVIDQFMIQGGDPIGDGTGSPGYEFADEIGTRTFDKPGILAMANSGPNTNGSQFFITVAPQEHLNGHYSIFGEVVSGQDVVDAISKVPTDPRDKPLTPVKLIRVLIKSVPAAKPGTPVH